jgi:DNA-binding MarR family transcriptional regulator
VRPTHRPGAGFIGQHPHEHGAICYDDHHTNNTNLCYLRYQCSFSLVPTDAEITFADHAGRLYARRYGFAPMVGRLIGYLSLCDPREQTIAELADALLASRSAITGAVNTLENLGLVHRSRAAGERMDRVHIDLTGQAFGFDVSEYKEQADLAREGLEVLADASPERRAVLLEYAAFAAFLVERLPLLEQEWRARREALRKAGELPVDEPNR